MSAQDTIDNQQCGDLLADALRGHARSFSHVPSQGAWLRDVIRLGASQRSLSTFVAHSACKKKKGRRLLERFRLIGLSCCRARVQGGQQSKQEEPRAVVRKQAEIIEVQAGRVFGRSCRLRGRLSLGRRMLRVLEIERHWAPHFGVRLLSKVSRL